MENTQKGTNSNFEIHPSIFREYDIRGLAGIELNADFAECLGKAYALFISQRNPTTPVDQLTVSVGWDCRLTSDSYAAALVSGLSESGLNVVRLGVCPTPLTYFSIFDQNLDGGIMITGSHNPGAYNGFKICVGKETIHGTQIQVMRTLMESIQQGTQRRVNPVPILPGKISDFDIIPKYIDHLVKNAKPLLRKKIVLDAGNGTASTVAPELFSRLGADVIPLFCELDGRFPNHHPDPTVPENLKDLVAEVLSTKADFGIAFDGDSDRIGLVDEKGRILFGDELMILFSRSILKDNPGATIISEVKSSYKLYDDIAKNGGNPIMWKTGHSLIKSKMKETGSLLAGEMSGHMFFADRYFGFDDAIYAGLRVYEIACDAKAPLSSLLADLPFTVSTPEIRIECDESQKFKLVEETKNRLAKTYTVNDIDGVRVNFGDSWGLVRASNTQAVLVMRFEAPTPVRLNEVKDIMQAALVGAAAAISHAPLELNSTQGAH